MNNSPARISWARIAGASLVLGIIAFAVIVRVFLGVTLKTDHGPGTRTLHLLKDVQVGIKSYQTEYNKWPVPESQEDYFAVLRGSLVKCLLGENDELNPRAIKFMELPLVDLTRQGRLKGGLMFDNLGEPWVLDEWGRPLYIGIDTNNDESVSIPDGAKDAPKQLPLGVALFSSGPDGIPGNADDMKTWR